MPATSTVGVVYLLHFKVKYQHAQHYIGWAYDLGGRMRHHRAGTGGKLVDIIQQHGIDWEIARTWEGKDRAFERYLKRRRDSPRFCPICSPGNRRVIV